MTNDLTAAAALIRLEAAARDAYASLRTIGLAETPARDAVLAQVAGVVEVAAYDRDGIPLPAVDTDDDTGGGGIEVRSR